MEPTGLLTLHDRRHMHNALAQRATPTLDPPDGRQSQPSGKEALSQL